MFILAKFYFVNKTNFDFDGCNTLQNSWDRGITFPLITMFNCLGIEDTNS